MGGWPNEVVEAKSSMTSLPSSSSSIAVVHRVGHTEEERARVPMRLDGFHRGAHRREAPVVIMEVAEEVARGGDDSNSGAGGYSGDG